MRKFTNTLMVILLGIELVNTVVWLIGVNIAGAVDGAAPWKALSAERGDRICSLGISFVNYWL